MRIGRPESTSETLLNIVSRPLVELYEGWIDESGIDATRWTTTNSATGPGWSRGASGAYLRATEAPNTTENCRLVSDQRYIVAPDTYGTNTILRKLCLEFELKLTTPANIEEAETFFGFTGGVADKRSSNDIVGWAILSDVLQSLTDDGSTETTTTTFGETITNWNKLKMEIYSGHVVFFVNESQVADHITNLPDEPMYINFYTEANGGAGAVTFEIGIIRVWYEDEI